jgi:hypothetical protein
MRALAATTIVTKSRLAQARVLAASLREHHPELELLVVLADAPEGCFDPGREPFEVVALERLAIPDRDALLVRSSAVQVATLAKPFALSHVLDRGFGAALFLDPDMLVTGDLGALLDAVRAHAVVLTPHLVEPLRTADRVARDLNIIVSGTANAGVVGVRDDGEGRAFLAWWRDRLVADCRHAPHEGVFYDQRWLDLAIGFFDDVHLHRDPRVNVGHWRLPETVDDGAAPGLVHFSGFDPDAPDIVSAHAAHRPPEQLAALAPLAAAYARRLRAAGHDEVSVWPYAYGPAG